MPAPEGPRFLTSSPVSVPAPGSPTPSPAPEDKAAIEAPRSLPPYRTPGIMPPPMQPVPRAAATEQATVAADEPGASEPTPASFGDRAGEHLRMPRGKYRAWSYVVAAYIIETLILGAIPAAVVGFAFPGVLSDPTIAISIYMVSGAVLAALVFRDRWRCIEAYSSRFCSGLANLSLLYVPLIALVYANVRGVTKWRERSR